MSGRYSQWRALRGDLDRPELVDLGKRLLAYLENQRKLSGVKTNVIERQLLDGSVVRASFHGDLPKIEIKAAEKETPKFTGVVNGFFGRPTTLEREVLNGSNGFYGTWWSEGGDPHHIPLLGLKPEKATAESLRGFWFNQALVPDGSKDRFYEKWFGQPEGLQRTANVDWTGDAGVLYFYGPLNRYNDAHTYYTPLIFHNGALLVDMADFAAGAGMARVLGAALHGTGINLELRVIVNYGFGNDIEVFRLPLTSGSSGYADVPLYLHPRLKLTYDENNAIVFESLGLFAFGPNDTGYRHPLFFNQRGDECRCINQRYDNAINKNVPYEVVISFDDDGLAFSASNISGTVIATATPNTNDTGSVALNVPGLLNEMDGLTFPARIGLAGGATPTSPTRAQGGTTYEAPWVKTFVDYRDNVPVYLEQRDTWGTDSNLAELTYTTSGAGGKAYWENLLNNEWVNGNGMGEFPPLNARTMATYTYTDATETHTGYRTDWMNLQSDHSTGGLTIFYRDRHATDINFDGQPSLYAHTVFNDTLEVDTVLERDEKQLLYCDLRNKIMCYKRDKWVDTFTKSETDTTKWSDIGPLNGTGKNFTQLRTVVGAQTVVLSVAGVVVHEDDTGVEDTSQANSGFIQAPIEPDTYPTALQKIIATGIFSQGNTYSRTTPPPQLSFVDLVLHDDSNVVSAHVLCGSWAVSGKVVAYSYSIESVFNGAVEAPADQIDQRHGFCSTDGLVAAMTWHTLSGANDTSVYKRYSPITAISPFVIK